DGEPAVQEVAIDLGVIEQDRDEACVLRAQTVQAEAGVNAGLELHRDGLVVTHVIVGTPYAANVLAGLDRPSSCLDTGFDRCHYIVGPASLVVYVELRRTVPACVLERTDDAPVRRLRRRVALAEVLERPERAHECGTVLLHQPGDDV